MIAEQKEMMIRIVGGFIVGLVLALMVLAFVGCKSFKPVVIQGQPDECNDFYSVLGYYTTADKGDSAFIGTVYNECKNARSESRKAVREKHCKDLIYGQGNFDKDDYKKYNQYLECVK